MLSLFRASVVTAALSLALGMVMGDHWLVGHPEATIWTAEGAPKLGMECPTMHHVFGLTTDNGGSVSSDGTRDCRMGGR